MPLRRSFRVLLLSRRKVPMALSPKSVVVLNPSLCSPWLEGWRLPSNVRVPQRQRGQEMRRKRWRVAGHQTQTPES